MALVQAQDASGESTPPRSSRTPRPPVNSRFTRLLCHRPFNIISIADKPNSPGLILDLPSNNPFRNRTASPANSLPSPRSLNFNIQGGPERPRSRNPFLGNTEQPEFFAPKPTRPTPSSPQKMSGNTSPIKAGLYGNTAELFVSTEECLFCNNC